MRTVQNIRSRGSGTGRARNWRWLFGRAIEQVPHRLQSVPFESVLPKVHRVSCSKLFIL